MNLFLKNKVWQKIHGQPRQSCVHTPLSEPCREGFGLFAGVAEGLISFWELFLVSSITYY